MTTINSMGEFVDTEPPRTVTVRTDEQKAREALAKLVDRGIVRVCDVCGEPFRTSDPYRRNAKRCSWECKQEANRRNARANRLRKKKEASA